MRASDRTYLQSLGFQDPDKHNSLHDQACIFLAQRHKAGKLYNLFWKDEIPGFHRDASCPDKPQDKCYYNYDFIEKSENLDGEIDVKFNAKLSHPLFMEERRYSYSSQKIIGYGDLLLNFESIQNYKAKWLVSKRVSHGSLIESYEQEVTCTSKRSDRLLVEVKAGKSPLSNIIQQLKTYRMAFDGPIVLATLYLISEAGKELLRNEGFTHIYLDPKIVAEEYSKLTSKVIDETSF